jgi:hypothetical protein
MFLHKAGDWSSLYTQIDCDGDACPYCKQILLVTKAHERATFFRGGGVDVITRYSIHSCFNIVIDFLSFVSSFIYFKK